MTESQLDSTQLMREAVVELRRLRARVDQLESARAEPIAVCGIGCRFPGGADSPAAFWTLLNNGVDATCDTPPKRWPGAPRYRGGFLREDLAAFDPLFFGISPREAVSIDPQQRLLLEVAWEALEDAGIPPDSLRGDRCGVFVGMCTDDYALLGRTLGQQDVYSGLGVMRSIAAGRVSYVFGLQGPNLVVDTACSSSLLAVHLAMQSLRLGECDLALAGGVNLMIVPDHFEALGRLHALASDGRCKSFDAAADGFARGEGCALVVLKRLDDASTSRDRIQAVLLGSAVNHDGPSTGLTAPNVIAQVKLLKNALTNARVSPDDIDHVEAHGTGTSLGDPVEMAALTEVFAPRHAQAVLQVGSVKTNIGHTEAAAGIAGLTKVVLALDREWIPRHLNYQNPNPHIDWARAPVAVTAAGVPWPGEGRTRRAIVSAFGMSGTNVCVVVESAPEQTRRADSPRIDHLLTLSARTEPALREMARRYARWLAGNSGVDVSDVCFSANVGRSRLPHRLALLGRDAADFCRELDNFANGVADPLVMYGEVPGRIAGQVEPIASDPGESAGWLARLQALADSWIRGAAIDWTLIDNPAAHSRVALPTYPFQRQRYWIDTPSTHADFLRTLQVDIQDAVNTAASDPRLSAYWRVLDGLDSLATAWVTAALEELGLDLKAGCSFSIDDLLARFSVAPWHQRFVGRLLTFPAEDSAPELRGNGWWMSDERAGPDPAALRAELEALCPDATTELELVERCGRNLPAVLRGQLRGLQALFPDGDLSLLSKLYGEAPFALVVNGAVRMALERILSNWSDRAPIRLLEVGAGTGATTAHLLRVLDPERVQYTFTDVSRLFLAKARTSFSRFGSIDFRQLDLDRSPAEQGFDDGSFDVIIAANVLHAAAEVRPALERTRGLLAPGGVLLVMETTSPQRWVDLFAGMTESWWHSRDLELRPEHPLLSIEAWLRLFDETGFEKAVVVEPTLDGKPMSARPALFIARVSGNPCVAAQDFSSAVARVRIRAVPADRTVGDLARQVRELDFEQAVEALGEVVRREVASVVGLDEVDAVDPRQGLFELGVDSLVSIELKARLDQSLAISLPITDIFDYPSVNALRDHIANDVLELRTSPPSGLGSQGAETSLDEELEAIERLLGRSRS